jgi:hypothetical protein
MYGWFKGKELRKNVANKKEKEEKERKGVAQINWTTLSKWMVPVSAKEDSFFSNLLSRRWGHRRSKGWRD